MIQQCTCDYSSEDFSREKKADEENDTPNRIFLNFSREFHHPAKDRYNEKKVKELFRYLRVRQDLQEMKVSGWSDGNESSDKEGTEEKEEAMEEEEYKFEEGEEESYYDEDSSRRGRGQRFAMSRDYWYRKLNTLKSQKLDEAALEARDLHPSDEKGKFPKIAAKKGKIYSYELPEKKEKLCEDLQKFEKCVAKPAENILKTKFVNVYDNREHFRKD